MKNIFVGIIAIPLITIGCKKETETIHAASIELTTPLDSTYFSIGDTIKISGVAKNSTSMHGYTVKVHALNDTTTLYAAANHDHATTINIAEAWVNTLPAEKRIQLDITVKLDHDGNKVTKTRTVICKP